MGNDQIAQVRMFSAIQAVVEVHKTLIPRGASLLAPYSTFAALLSYLNRAPEGGQQATTGPAPDKGQLRADVITACLRFAAALRSHGNATGNEEMQAGGRVSRAALEAAPDTAFAAAALNILCWIDRLSSSILSTYSIAPSEVRGTYALLTSFSRCTKEEHTANTRTAFDPGERPRIVAALAEILETMMDPAVELLAIAQPGFYTEYFGARISLVTKDSATATQPKTIAVAAPPLAAGTGSGFSPMESRRENNFGSYAQSA